jgi:hypothetical protein
MKGGILFGSHTLRRAKREVASGTSRSKDRSGNEG